MGPDCARTHDAQRAPSRISRSAAAKAREGSRSPSACMGLKQRKRQETRAAVTRGAIPRRETEKERLEREDREDREFEEKCEKACEKYCGRICLVWMLITPFLSFLGFVTEFATRPHIVPEVSGHEGGEAVLGITAAIVGGCGAIGGALASMLAEGGANVVLGCRNMSVASATISSIEATAAAKSTAQGASGIGTAQAFPVDLGSFKSVQRFARQVDKHVGKSGLNILVNAAAKFHAEAAGDGDGDDAAPGPAGAGGGAAHHGCVFTADGFERNLQVNFLSHAHLVQLLLPALRRAGAASAAAVEDGADDDQDEQPDAPRATASRNKIKFGARIVGVTCDIAQSANLGALGAGRLAPSEALPFGPFVAPPSAGGSPKEEDNGQGNGVARLVEGDSVAACSPRMQYGAAKLAVIAFAAEVERKLRRSTDADIAGVDAGIVSHAVDPGLTDSPLQAAVPTAEVRMSLRARVMSYFPPVWLLGKLYRFAHSTLVAATMREPRRAAAAVFHVLTSPHLGHPQVAQEHGGALFADTAGPFSNCGQHPARCGRVGTLHAQWAPFYGAPVQHAAEYARSPSGGAALWKQLRSALPGFADADPVDAGYDGGVLAGAEFDAHEMLSPSAASGTAGSDGKQKRKKRGHKKNSEARGRDAGNSASGDGQPRTMPPPIQPDLALDALDVDEKIWGTGLSSEESVPAPDADDEFDGM